MPISKIEIQSLEIPFRQSFKHSSSERRKTEAILVTVTDSSGIITYGEGCPRSYVTGEDIESAKLFFGNVRSEIMAVKTLPELRSWISNNFALIDVNPAAWCAIESALLDLFGRIQGVSLENLLGLDNLKGDFRYSAVLGLNTPEVFLNQLAKYQSLGITDFKLKISGNLDLDRHNILSLTEGHAFNSLRLDANNLWSNECEAISYLATLPAGFFAIEEPLSPGEYVQLINIAETLPARIILDESFLRLEQFTHIQDNVNQFIPNIRISKMGGLLRSLDIAERCRELNLKFIVGAQVGETSILTRLALSLVNQYRDLVLYQEGAFGTYLLERDLVDRPLMFGKKGRLEYDFLGSNGSGLEFNI